MIEYLIFSYSENLQRFAVAVNKPVFFHQKDGIVGGLIKRLKLNHTPRQLFFFIYQFGNIGDITLNRDYLIIIGNDALPVLAHPLNRIIFCFDSVG